MYTRERERERERERHRQINYFLDEQNIYSCIRTFHSCYNRIFRTKIYNGYGYKLISFTWREGGGVSGYLHIYEFEIKVTHISYCGTLLCSPVAKCRIILNFAQIYSLFVSPRGKGVEGGDRRFHPCIRIGRCARTGRTIKNLVPVESHPTRYNARGSELLSVQLGPSRSSVPPLAITRQ